MRRGAGFLQALILALLIAVAITILGVSLGVLSPRREAQGEVAEVIVDKFVRAEGTRDLEIVPFEFVNQDGKRVDESIFDGRLTLLDFMFTNCPLVCPQMTGNMIQVQLRLADTPLRTVTISVDPARDTPERLRAHAAPFADFDRWTFLTGDEATVERVASGLSLGLTRDEENPISIAGGLQMANIIHPTKFVLVGPDREVLAMYSGLSEEEIGRIERDVRLILRDAAASPAP